MRISVYAGALVCAVALGVTAVAPSAHAQSQNNNQASKTVEVKAGDTLDGIATANGTTFHRLYDANVSVEDPNLIFPGEKLRIPSKDEQLASRSLPVPAPVAPVVAAVEPVQVEVAAPAAVETQAYVPEQPAAPVYSSGSGVWDQLAQCEAGGNWAINTGNGFYGGLQFTLSSWQAAGGSGMPHQASREEQIARGEILQSMQGWGAWPACSSKLGLR